MKRIHVFVSGRVQRVGFRAATRRKAKELGVRGWVKNLEDGRVETVAEGDGNSLEKFLEFLHEGNRIARVRNLKVREEESKGEFNDFEIRY